VSGGLGTGPVGFRTRGWAGGVWWSWGDGVRGGDGGENGCGWGGGDTSLVEKGRLWV